MVTNYLYNKLLTINSMEDCQDVYHKLGYDIEIPALEYNVKKWSLPSKKVLIDNLLLIARKDDFKLFFAKISYLSIYNERIIIESLSETERHFIIFFQSKSKSLIHLVNPYFFDQHENYEERLKSGFRLQKFSFGEDLLQRTASEQLSIVKISKDDNWITAKIKHDEAFNLESVTDKFFQHFKSALNDIKNELKNQNILNVNEIQIKEFSLQLMNRIMLLYFIQKKNWLNNSKTFIKDLYTEYENIKSDSDNFYYDWLRPIFEYGFNNKIPDGTLNNRIIDIVNQFPYLNEDLFHLNRLDRFNFEIKDSLIKNIIVEFFENYNFTITESTPLNQEIAVDPEMLGKVYESLLGEEEQTSGGIFYTPRIEVDLMCRLSLIEYLVNENLLSKNEAISFVYCHESIAKLIDREKIIKIITYLENIKIIDPSCGSGAFLISMAKVLYEIFSKYTDNKFKLLSIKKRIIKDNIFGVDLKHWAIQLSELRLWLWLIIDIDFEEIKSSKDQNVPLLPNLDLKLRVGDSLFSSIFDKSMKKRVKTTVEKKEFVNTIKDQLKDLIELKSRYFSGLESEFDLEKIKSKEKMILMSITNEKYVENVKQSDLLNLKSKKTEISKSFIPKDRKNQKFSWEIDFAEVFIKNGGFDIVIGNPPYIRQEEIGSHTTDKEAYKKELLKKMEFYFGKEIEIPTRSDYLIYFFYLSLHILKNRGVHVFVTSASWLDVEYGVKLQEYLLNNTKISYFIDNAINRSFKASVNTVISVLSLKDSSLNNQTSFLSVKKSFESIIFSFNRLLNLLLENKDNSNNDYTCRSRSKINLYISGGMKYKEYKLEGNYDGFPWGGHLLRAPDIFHTIIQKSGKKLVKLNEITNVRRGFTSGCNEFFYLPSKHFDLEESNADFIKLIPKSGLDSEILLEKRFLKDVVFSLKELKTMGSSDLNIFTKKVFFCNSPKEKIAKMKVINYINWGESKNFHQRSMTKSRPIWYSLGTRPIADLIFPSKIGERFLVYKNDRKLFEDKKQYGLIINNKKNLNNLFLALNSSIYRLFIECSSRQLTGAQTISDIDVRIVASSLILVPKFSESINIIRPILSIFDELGFDKSKPILDQKPNPKEDRLRLDKIVFDYVGLDEEERNEVYIRLAEIVQNRNLKSASK